MEVTTVYPSPASPTEGDDLCDIDVTHVAIHSVTLLISPCGLAGNGAFLCLLGLKERDIGVFIVDLLGFLFLLFTVPSVLLFLVEDVSCSPIMPLPYLSFLLQFSVVSCYWVQFQLILLGNIINMEKFCKLCPCDLPERFLWLGVSVVFCAFFALFTVIPAVTYLCSSHQQEHCRAALISVHALILLLFAAPMVISHTIDFIKAMWGSKKLKPKRHNIVLFLIVLFILGLSPCNFLQHLGYTVESSQVLFLLNCIPSSIKPFIRYLVSTCWEISSLKNVLLSLQRAIDELEEEDAHSNEDTVDTGV
ncbi:uncharacterized protein LOC134550799 [Prinia subflava]|uniref:uncharacterized protein LOC134550799 n=1 Tax=Prinia subflava TaxID=208062 RepID=UPI002FDFFBE1